MKNWIRKWLGLDAVEEKLRLETKRTDGMQSVMDKRYNEFKQATEYRGMDDVLYMVSESDARSMGTHLECYSLQQRIDAWGRNFDLLTDHLGVELEEVPAHTKVVKRKKK